MTRKLVTFFSNYLSLLGLHRDFRRPFRLGISALLLTTGSIQYLVFLSKNTATVYGVTLPFSHLLITMIVVSSLVSFLLYYKNVYLLLKKIDQNFYIYSNESNIKPEYSWLEEENNLFKLFLCFLTYSFVGTASMCLSPFVQFLFLGRVEVLIYSGWIPWKIDKVVPFVCAYMINFSTVIVCITWYNLFVLLPLYITIEFRRQVKRLCTALRNIGKAGFQKAEPKIIFLASSKRRSEFNTNQVSNFIECTEHHQMLLQ